MIRGRWDAPSTWRISSAAVWGGPVGARARQSPSSCCGRRTECTSGVVSTRAAIRRCRRFRKPWRAPWRPLSRARSAPSSERRWRAAHRAILEPTIASCARTTSSHSGRRARCVGRSTNTRAPCGSIRASRPPSPGWPSVTGCSSTGGGSIPACLRRPCCLAGSTRLTAPCGRTRPPPTRGWPAASSSASGIRARSRACARRSCAPSGSIPGMRRRITNTGWRCSGWAATPPPPTCTAERSSSNRSGRSPCSTSGGSPRGRANTRRPVAGRTALWPSTPGRAALVLPSGAGVRPGPDRSAVPAAGRGVAAGMRRSGRLIALLLLSACQPQARRLLLLDLALSEPALLNSTVQPWRDEGYAVEYRRFYPHLARADLGRYRVLLFLLGREPEAPSDALTAGDLALLTEWVLRGGVVVLGYDADGEGYLDRWTANRWLEFAGTGISIGDRLLEDTTGRTATTTGRLQPWAEGRAMGDEPLGSVFDPFPLDRNNVLATRDASQLLAVTSRHAFVRAPRTPAPRPGAGVAAATRIGDGLVVVISRHALGALGPQFRPTTAPAQQLDALERTGEFLHALARWTRRPAEWAHVPPAARGVPLALAQAPVPVELVAPGMTPPRGVDTITLPLLPDPN